MQRITKSVSDTEVLYRGRMTAVQKVGFSVKVQKTG